MSADVIPFPITPDRVVVNPPCRIVPDQVATAIERQRGRIENRYVRHRERAGLDIPAVPAELTEETRADLLGVATVSITFPRPPKWWQIIRRFA